MEHVIAPGLAGIPAPAPESPARAEEAGRKNGPASRLAGRLKRAVRGAWRLGAARLLLRRCASVGRWVTVRGRPRIDADGEIRLGDGVRIHSHLARTQLSAGPGARLVIGADTFINSGAVLSARSEVVVGARCQIATGVTVMDSDFHGVDDRDSTGKTAPILIEDDVWLATRAIILKGVRIGRGSVVAAGAVVTRDVPPYTLVGGVPARTIRIITPEPKP